jgi:hypothetical protein
MPRASKRTTPKKSISILDLPMHRDYTFAYFSEVAIKLCTGKDISELNQQTLNSIVSEVANCIGVEIESMKKVKNASKKSLDPCKFTPVPTTKNDPRDKMNICYAQKILVEFTLGTKHSSLVISSPYALEFAEFTRSLMGVGKLKRELFIIDEEVLALAVIGSYLSYSYELKGEYGYVYVDVVPYVLELDRVKSMNKVARRIVNRIQKNEGSLNTVMLGIAVAVSKAVGMAMKDVVRRDAHLVVNFLRVARTKNKVIAKGFDTVDIVQLAKIVGRGGIAKPLYAMLVKYPPKEFSSLRRFIELTSTNLIKFQSFRKPQYIYEILRYLTSEELNVEGRQWYVKKDDKGLSWEEIVYSFSNLSRLIR